MSMEVDNGSNVAIKPLNNRSRQMPTVEFVEVTAGLRGKGNKDKKVTYRAINEDTERPDNPMDAALELSNGDLAIFWKRFVNGYNEAMYTEVADPIAEFIDASWSDDIKKSFRTSVNALAKTLGMDKEDVATFLVAKMKGESA